MSTTGLDTVIGTPSTRDPRAAAERMTKGRQCEEAGDRLGAITQYRAAVDADPTTEAMFRLAYMLDLVGEGKVRARLFMPTAQATSLRPGQRLAARFGASGVRHAIVVESISPRVDGASQLVEIEGRFDGPTAGLTPGMVGLVERAARTTGGQGS